MSEGNVNTIVNPRELQRLRYTPGQDLLSRDFRDQGRFDAQLRWWHNRAMHGAFGVRYGLAVRPVETAPEPQVEVAPGLAYDAFGRELILAAPATLTVPEGPNEIDPRVLVLSQGAELVWMPASQVRAASGVPLARVTYDDGEPAPDETFRAPAARPFARPKLGYGSTIAGATEWEIWDLEIGHRFLLGLQITLDTRAAGFTEPPCYFAWLQGGIEQRLKPEEPGAFLPLYSHLADTTLTSFRFRVITVTLGTAVGSGGRNLLLSIARRQLSVCWLGIQMPSGETPLPEVIHGHP